MKRNMRNIFSRQSCFSLATDSPVLSFSSSRMLRVNYNPRLVGLVREVSQLSILGHKIHPDIIKTAKLAQKFMKQAKALEEVRGLCPSSINHFSFSSSVSLIICVFLFLFISIKSAYEVFDILHISFVLA